MPWIFDRRKILKLSMEYLQTIIMIYVRTSAHRGYYVINIVETSNGDSQSLVLDFKWKKKKDKINKIWRKQTFRSISMNYYWISKFFPRKCDNFRNSVSPFDFCLQHFLWWTFNDENILNSKFPKFKSKNKIQQKSFVQLED